MTNWRGCETPHLRYSPPLTLGRIGQILLRRRRITFAATSTRPFGSDKRNDFQSISTWCKSLHTFMCCHVLLCKYPLMFQSVMWKRKRKLEAEAAIFYGSGSGSRSGKHEMNGSGSGSGSSKKILEAEAEAIKITSLV